MGLLLGVERDGRALRNAAEGWPSSALNAFGKEGGERSPVGASLIPRGKAATSLDPSPLGIPHRQPAANAQKHEARSTPACGHRLGCSGCGAGAPECQKIMPDQKSESTLFQNSCVVTSIISCP